MTVTELKREKGHLMRVRFEGGESILLDLDFCVEKCIHEGDGISPETVKEYLSESDYIRAKSRAIWLLDRYTYTERRLFETLKTAGSVLESGECLFIKDLKISGSDIIKMGCPQGPKVGDVLEALLQKVLDEPGLNDADSLKEMAEEMVSGFKDDQAV